MPGFDLSKIGKAPTKNSPQVATDNSSPVVASPPSVNAQPPSPTPTQKMGLGALLRGNASMPKIPVVIPEILPPSESLPVPVVASSGPEGLQGKLQRLDELIGEIAQISSLELSGVRSYVVEIMRDLKEFPEFRGIVRAKDVHNLMEYVQATSSQAGNQFALQAEKKATATETKRKANNIDLGPLLAGFSPEFQAKKQATLGALTSINTDSIKAITKK